MYCAFMEQREVKRLIKSAVALTEKGNRPALACVEISVTERGGMRFFSANGFAAADIQHQPRYSAGDVATVMIDAGELRQASAALKGKAKADVSFEVCGEYVQIGGIRLEGRALKMPCGIDRVLPKPADMVSAPHYIASRDLMGLALTALDAVDGNVGYTHYTGNAAMVLQASDAHTRVTVALMARKAEPAESDVWLPIVEDGENE